MEKKMIKSEGSNRKAILAFVSMGFELVILVVTAMFLAQNPAYLQTLEEALGFSISPEALILMALFIWFVSLFIKVYLYTKENNTPQ